MLDDGITGSDLQILGGTDEATVDDKGRLLVQKKKRDALGASFTIAQAEVGCLVAYPITTWHEIYNDVKKVPSINVGRQQYVRLTIGNSESDLNFDSQGRVVIPQKLRDLAKIKDKVVLIGAMDRMEIWAKAEYEKYLQNPDGYGAERLGLIAKAYDLMKKG